MTFSEEKVTPDEAIGFLIAAKGNSSLAAVYASKDRNTPITEAQLIAAITDSDDPATISRNLSSLTAQLRILLVLNTVEAFRITHTAYLQMLPHLSAKETASTYTKLLDALTVLATPPPPANSPNSPSSPNNQLTAETLRALMPPEVQAALDQLSPTTPNAATSPEP
jgi:hypothetical protein